MPLYFFHLNFGHRVLPDEEGVELPNRSAAREEDRELLARQQHAAQLLERNRQLRQELSSVFLISERMQVRARQLVAQSRLASCR
jgi:hypothetical protein